MPASITPMQSDLPWLVFVLPTAVGLFILLVGRFSRWLREGVALAGLAATFVVSAQVAAAVLHGHVLTAWGQTLYVDGLSALMEILGSLMGAVIVVYSIRFISHEVTGDPASTRRRYTTYYALLLLFIGMMNWTCATNNVIMLWVSLEATTFATAFLVTFYWRRESLEAGYKYLLLVTVGVTFALFGCVLVYTAAVPLLGGRAGEALLLTSLGKVAGEIPKNIALLASAFFIAGFGTKAGLVPFHAWLPDAHAEAPAPVSALLSGIVIKVGAYALARTITMFSGYSAVVVFVAILCSASMLIGMGLAFVQDDLKRMLAYSSVAQIAYVVEGLGLGTYLGIYGGLFHLINHTLIKALLFLSAGAVMYATGTRKISELSGLARTMPVTAFCFLVGALAIGGLPPLNGFWSKLTLFLALGDKGLLWAAVIGVVTAMMSVACFLMAAYKVFWGAYRAPAFAAANPHAKEVPASMWGGMVALALLCVSIGIYPRLVYPLLDSATRCILSILGR